MIDFGIIELKAPSTPRHVYSPILWRVKKKLSEDDWEAFIEDTIKAWKVLRDHREALLTYVEFLCVLCPELHKLLGEILTSKLNKDDEEVAREAEAQPLTFQQYMSFM